MKHIQISCLFIALLSFSCNKKSETIIGSWKDQNSISEYLSDSVVKTKWNKGGERLGKWKINLDTLIEIVQSGQTWEIDSNGERLVDDAGSIYRYRITQLSSDSLVTQDAISHRVWNASRIN